MQRWVRGAAAAVMVLAILAGLGCDAGQSSGGTEPLPPQDGLEVGEKAPALRLKNQDQATVVLSDYLGESNVILVFFPLAFTPV